MTARLGSISEAKAKVWLLEQGYEVFQNVCPVGPADLVAWTPEDGCVVLIDVKTVRHYQRADGSTHYSKKNSSWEKSTQLGVRILCFNPDIEMFYWGDEGPVVAI